MLATSAGLTSTEALIDLLQCHSSQSNLNTATAAVTMSTSIGNSKFVDMPLFDNEHSIHPSEGNLTHSALASPPLIHCASTSPNFSPFTLAFIAVNIRVYRQKYPNPALPPMDLGHSV